MTRRWYCALALATVLVVYTVVMFGVVIPEVVR